MPRDLALNLRLSCPVYTSLTCTRALPALTFPVPPAFVAPRPSSPCPHSAAEAVSTEECPVKMKLVAPPLYVLTTQTLDKVKGVEVLTQGEGGGGARVGRGRGQRRKQPQGVQAARMPLAMTWRRAVGGQVLTIWPRRVCCTPLRLMR